MEVQALATPPVARRPASRSRARSPFVCPPQDESRRHVTKTFQSTFERVPISNLKKKQSCQLSVCLFFEIRFL